MLLEYITNIYILPLISSIIGLCIVYLYDKFEKKQYTTAMYLRIGILIYISTYSSLYISKLDFFSSTGGSSQSGGSFDPQLSMPQGNDLKTHLEQFKIGVPTF
jgi:hypothetical protein